MSRLKLCPQCGTEYEPDVKFCSRDGSALRGRSDGGSLVGQVIAERYSVLSKLGEGGMGQVYLAEHVKMGRKSAIKVMSPSMMHDAEAIGRFNREAANASRISHPNVAAIYDFGETADGLIYLAMEYVDGEPLTRLLERGSALPVPRAVDIARQVAGALDAAHELGIVHRDLKPDNIMLARARDGRDVVKVVDFGIAKAGQGEGQNVTRTGLVVGTPEYMSPEQLSGDALDGRSDIYALALVTFHMLTGTLPFPSETAQESMIMRLTDRPRTLAEMRGDVQWEPALQPVLDRALARLAAERYQRASEFAGELEGAATGRAPDAREAPTLLLDAATVALDRPSPARTVPLTAARSAPPVSRTQPMRPPRRRVLPAVAALVVLVLAAGAMAMRARSNDRGAPPAPPTLAAERDTMPGSGADTAQRRPVLIAAANASTPEVSRPRPEDQHPVDPPATEPRSTEPPPTRMEPRPNRARTDGTGAGRARLAVATAGRAIEQAIAANQQEPLDRALRELRRALPRLDTRADSVVALYHVSEALIAKDQRLSACGILEQIRNEPGRWRRAINSNYMSFCGSQP